MAKLSPRLQLDGRILTLRGYKVILDSDLAAIYRVTTKRLNEQVRRNAKKFPADFAFQLTTGEWADLRAQVAKCEVDQCTLQSVTNQGLTPNWSQNATSSSSRRGAAYRPWAFTEHGALQAANILNSPRAVAMSVYVIRAFIKLREQLAANEAISKRLAEIDQALLTHDVALRDIYKKLIPLLTPPPEPPRPEMGFHVKEESVPYRVRRRLDL